MEKKLAAVAAAVFAISACSKDREPVTPAVVPQLSLSADPDAEIIPGRYIVTLSEGVSPKEIAAAHGVRPDFVYSRALNGFAANMPDAIRDALLRDSRVTRVEPDGIVHAYTTQSGATWGLDRIDQRSLPLSTTYSYTNDGSGVTAYIIDTGIRFDHSEFGGRAISGFDAIDGGTADDCNGHGTHVSGTVGGATYGVAKGVTLVAVRVLNCAGSGSNSQVIAGIDWVTTNHTPGAPAVANMSLGGAGNVSLDVAVQNSIADGVSYAVAAGNGNLLGQAKNACNPSPARVPEAMTIGASDMNDVRASFSNYGSCVDWFAPGVDITSSWFSSATATAVLSGTSMAAPHTAGVAALYLQSNPGASPAAVRTALYDKTTKNIVTRSNNTVNRHLLFSDF
ncbi:MAG TPA: S8 family peptidase [Gemmatimonadaceae bacterium]|nr:S8 family peptidase [Gemmatimonadaceae bacterium]